MGHPDTCLKVIDNVPARAFYALFQLQPSSSHSYVGAQNDVIFDCTCFVLLSSMIRKWFSSKANVEFAEMHHTQTRPGNSPLKHRRKSLSGKVWTEHIQRFHLY